MAGGIYEQLDWPDSRSDYVQVCDGCHTAIWSTRWNEETSDGFDAFLARNGWREYFDGRRFIDLCPGCAVAALRQGELESLSDHDIHASESYETSEDLMDLLVAERERTLMGRLLPAA